MQSSELKLYSVKSWQWITPTKVCVVVTKEDKDKKTQYGFEISVLNKTAAEMFKDIWNLFPVPQHKNAPNTNSFVLFDNI